MQLYWGYSIQYCIQAQYFVLAGLEKPLAYTHESPESRASFARSLTS